MEKFHHSFKIRNLLRDLTPDEVRYVISRKTYTETLLAIDEVAKRRKKGVTPRG